ncbi:hypothetical protein SYYSPA8_12705 [Streptomyces yaizuensis]|uniref:Uncharacterized protein n=1 Tax=Streptomyces yaizuensis TaxID=2989713 RepID=A0ABQ5NXR1_9ACTN|nr:hypothetical protein [Streptomyces sp. YSPA8]GLF95160.1 hypothetical protein SYYSPA8_12705 [Streptomyces sp. YSPA8]
MLIVQVSARRRWTDAEVVQEYLRTAATSAITALVDGAPKPTRPGPGRPVGSKNRHVGRVLATGKPYARPAHHKTGTKPRRGNSPATPVHHHDPDDVG